MLLVINTGLFVLYPPQREIQTFRDDCTPSLYRLKCQIGPERRWLGDSFLFNLDSNSMVFFEGAVFNFPKPPCATGVFDAAGQASAHRGASEQWKLLEFQLFLGPEEGLPIGVA